MNLAITGVTGFIGRRLTVLAREAGHRVIGFSRQVKPLPGCAETRAFDLQRKLDFADCDAVIHLAGENIAGWWTKDKRRRIRESRVEGTRHVAHALAIMSHPPEVLVSISAIGFYGDTGERATDEAAPLGIGFLAEVARDWEKSAVAASEQGIRVVHPRLAVVLGRDGGALPLMTPAFKLGLGGRLGSGQQWMSWIHLDDVCRLLLFCVKNPALRGPVNASAPGPVRNVDFTQTLARVLHRPAMLPVPAFALRAVLGEFSRELLESKRVVPARAAAAGFPFKFSTLESALRDLLHAPA